MALVDLSGQTAPYTSDTGTASTSYAEQTLPKGTRTVTIQASSSIVWGYATGRGFPLAANTPLEIPVDCAVTEIQGTPIASIWIKADSGTPTIYLDCTPFRR